MTDQMEIWKPIKGYPKYQVSNIGRVKNIETNYILKNNNSYGLYYLVLLYNKGKPKLLAIHRLVAIAFIPNPQNKKEINHKDGNKHNNNVDNLEWCSRQENTLHSIRTGLQTQAQFKKAILAMKKANSKRIAQLKNGKLIKVYSSVREASRQLKISHSGIASCANGKYKTMNGYEWRYENDTAIRFIRNK